MISSLLTVSPNLGLVLPHMTDQGAAELAKGAGELAKGAAELAKGAKDFGVAALNTHVAKGCVVVALIGVTGWAVARVIHELRGATVNHDVIHRGTTAPTGKGVASEPQP
jgi:X-X-X-Leu-X-X-Gly heptad repeat protein